MRLLLLVNASASAVTARGRVVIQKALSADHEVTTAETSRRGHASRLAQGAAADGIDVVVVLGGDGTLNEAANGLAGTATALGVLPGGSTNVFARTIGTPADPIEATGSLLAPLARRSGRAPRPPPRAPPRGSVPPRRPGPPQRPLLPLPRGRGFGCRGGRPGRGGGGAEAVRRTPAFRVGGPAHVVPPLRPQPPAVLGAVRA